MKVKDKVFRYLTYARRGHTAWFAFALGFLNFVVLQYKLAVESISFLHSFFPSLLQFTLVFAIIYVPMITIIGWRDYKKGLFPAESTVATLAAPYYRDIAQALILICDEKPEEAKKVLQKWVKNV